MLLLENGTLAWVLKKCADSPNYGDKNWIASHIQMLHGPRISEKKRKRKKIAPYLPVKVHPHQLQSRVYLIHQQTHQLLTRP